MAYRDVDAHTQATTGNDLDDRPEMDHPEAVIVWIIIALGAWVGIGVIAWALIIVGGELWRAIAG